MRPIALAERREAPVINGFTGDQRFFLGWAQVWRTMFRDDALRQQLATGRTRRDDPRLCAAAQHRRVVQGVRHQAERSALHPPEDRVRIW
jgi:predicted metalloendopeptidase